MHHQVLMGFNAPILNGARGGGRTLTSMGYQILNLARLPIPPPGHTKLDNYEVIKRQP